MPKLSKKNILIILSISFILLIFLLLMFIPFNSHKLEYSVKKIFNDTPVFSNSGNSIDDKRFERFTTSYDGKQNEWDIVLTSFNLSRPKVSLVINFDTYVDVFVIELDRDTIISQEWKYKSYTSIDIKNRSFSEAVEIAKKYDLSKENPDPENIRVFDEEVTEPSEYDLRYIECLDRINSGEIDNVEDARRCERGEI
jgi:hypothetical protein